MYLYLKHEVRGEERIFRTTKDVWARLTKSAETACLRGHGGGTLPVQMEGHNVRIVAYAICLYGKPYGLREKQAVIPARLWWVTT